MEQTKLAHFPQILHQNQASLLITMLSLQTQHKLFLELFDNSLARFRKSMPESEQ